MPKSVFTDAYASFLEVLISERKAQGVSQVELAARLGKTQSWVSTYERGVRRIDVIEFYAIARKLRVPPAELFAKVLLRLPDEVEI